MQNITTSIDKVQDTPLAFSDLKRMLGKDANTTNFLMYDQLDKISPQELFGKPASIILIHKRNDNSNIGHFFAILNHGSELEHFDPYGLDLKNLYRLTGQPPILNKFYHNRKVKYNKYKLQQFANDIDTCGRWCVARIKLRNKSLATFNNFMKQPIHSGDEKVALLTYFL